MKRRFSRKICHPSPTNNYYVFNINSLYKLNKQLPAGYWILVEDWTNGSGSPRWVRDLSCQSWTALSNPLSHKIGHAQPRSITKWKWNMGSGWAGPKGKNKLQVQVTQVPMVPASHASLPLPQCPPLTAWLIPSDWLKEEGRAWSWLPVYLPPVLRKDNTVRLRSHWVFWGCGGHSEGRCQLKVVHLLSTWW